SGYFYKKYMSLSDITNDLLNDGYYVWNRFEKYYVIAFALDYVRFEIYSKDCDKILIKWRENDATDPIKGIIKGEYNQNPVITLVKSLNEHT
ncbi:MAG: hypothetical protein ACMG6E_09370, partial [Candidatus Roizmanbacteria bacterium]